jgi:hypothetical protein
MLKPGGDYMQELLAKIVQITGGFTPFFLSGTKISTKISSFSCRLLGHGENPRGSRPAKA